MSEKSKIKRIPKRGIYDRKEIYQILDNHFICHLAFIHNDVPIVIPTMYGRENDVIYVHGAAASRMLKELAKGVAMCLSVASVNALVLARSAFHHSLNYKSVVIFGNGKLIEDKNKKNKALKVISENAIKGRWDESRLPTSKELNATKVIAITIDEVSAKVRDEGVNDAKKDMNLPIWAGLVPINETYGKPIKSPDLNNNIELPKSVKNLNTKK